MNETVLLSLARKLEGITAELNACPRRKKRRRKQLLRAVRVYDAAITGFMRGSL